MSTPENGGPSRWKDVHVEAPGRASPAFVALVRSLLGPIVRVWHRPTLSGVENLPSTGAFLLVANHSGGIAIAEIEAFMVLYVERVGAERPLAAFAHPLGFRIFPASTILRSVGAIPSSYEAAASTLAAGVPLLVFPGGDHEALRPIWQANRVDLGGRRGFLRIARAAGVPVIPMGIRGSHLTAPLLWRSRYVLPTLLLVPRLLGIKRWALSVLGLAGALAIVLGTSWPWPWRVLAAWAWLASPFVFLPIVPWTIRMRIGKPIAADELFRDDDASLERALTRVQAEMQRLVDRE